MFWKHKELNKFSVTLRNCLKLEIMPKIKKIPLPEGWFLIFRTLFRVWGNPKNQNDQNLNSF